MGGEVLWVAANYYHNRERNKKDRFTSRRKRMQWQFSFIEKGAKRSSTGQPIGFLMLN